MPENECDCAQCVALCERRPGWFAPGEAEKVAAYLGLSLEDLFRRRLSVDYRTATKEEPREIYVLSPAIEGKAGGYFPFAPFGRCTFLTVDGKCEIHAVKPIECRMASGCKDAHDEGLHADLPRQWDHPELQQQLVELAGGKHELDPLEAIGGFFALLDDTVASIGRKALKDGEKEDKEPNE